MLGETASQEELKAHFYRVTGKAQEEAKRTYESNQIAKSAYSVAKAVNRSHGGEGMPEEEFKNLTDNWQNLNFYNIEGVG